MMKLFSSLTLVLFLSFFIVDASAQDQILGNWLSAEIENSTIQVYKADDGLIYGKIRESNKKEWIGETILKKLTYNASKKVWEGEIYSLQRKMTINATVSLTNDERLKLVGKKFFMTKTFYWMKQ